MPQPYIMEKVNNKAGLASNNFNFAVFCSVGFSQYHVS